MAGNTISDRIKSIRKDAGLTQEKFALRLGLTRNFIAQVETNKNTVSDRTIKDICVEFKINEAWLRTGEGEPRAPMTRKQAIADFMADCLRDEEDSFRSGLIEALAELSIEDWEVLEKIALSVLNKSVSKKKD